MFYLNSELTDENAVIEKSVKYMLDNVDCDNDTESIKLMDAAQMLKNSIGVADMYELVMINDGIVDERPTIVMFAYDKKYSCAQMFSNFSQPYHTGGNFSNSQVDKKKCYGLEFEFDTASNPKAVRGDKITFTKFYLISNIMKTELDSSAGYELISRVVDENTIKKLVKNICKCFIKNKYAYAYRNGKRGIHIHRDIDFTNSDNIDKMIVTYNYLWKHLTDEQRINLCGRAQLFGENRNSECSQIGDARERINERERLLTGARLVRPASTIDSIMRTKGGKEFEAKNKMKMKSRYNRSYVPISISQHGTIECRLGRATFKYERCLKTINNMLQFLTEKNINKLNYTDETVLLNNLDLED